MVSTDRFYTDDSATIYQMLVLGARHWSYRDKRYVPRPQREHGLARELISEQIILAQCPESHKHWDGEPG